MIVVSFPKLQINKLLKRSRYCRCVIINRERQGAIFFKEENGIRGISFRDNKFWIANTMGSILDTAIQIFYKIISSKETRVFILIFLFWDLWGLNVFICRRTNTFTHTPEENSVSIVFPHLFRRVVCRVAGFPLQVGICRPLW